MSALPRRAQPIDATPSNLARGGGVRWRGLHEYGSRRSRGLSFGSAGRTVNVWRISLGRLRGGTRAVSIVSRLSMAGIVSGAAPESLRERCGYEEREEISRRYCRRSLDTAWIALGLRRSPSTVSREIRRNGALRSAYRAGERRSARLQAGVAPEALSPGSPREATMAGRAEASRLQWSPEQIAGWLQRQLP